MKRVLFVILMLSICTLSSSDRAYSAYNADLPENMHVQDEEAPILPNIFIWQLPDESISSSEDVSEDNASEQIKEAEEPTDEELYLSNYDNVPIKGYLEFMENSDAISLKKNDRDFALNLSVPQKLDSSSIKQLDKINLPQTTFAQNIYARSSDDIQYNIAPVDHSTEISHGGFSIGTSYNESIDTSDLGFTTSFYTKYENKYFALKSSYDKNAGVSYSMVIDQFSFAPELKLNRYVSIKDVVTSDITRNRKKNELILSIKPLQDDRVRFEFGAGNTYDSNSELIRSQVKFSTQVKW